jgi:hypothetical protein
LIGLERPDTNRLFPARAMSPLFLHFVTTIHLSDLVTKKTVFSANNPPQIFKNARISWFEKYKMLYLLERNHL